MADHFEVIVVGIGAMGAAACWELARRGVRVLGLEQFDIPHNLGSSHGLSRMIRMAYYEHPDYVPLLRRAYERWRQIEAGSGRKLLHITGGMYMGARGCELVDGSARSAAQHKLDHELLDRAELSRRLPQFRLPDDWVGLYEPTAGWLAPEQSICAFVEQALRHGAVIHAHEPVSAWCADARGVSVTTDRATYHAEKLIFCGGPWTASLVRDLGIGLTVTRQVLLWLRPRRMELFAPERFSGVWAVGHADGSLHYGFPMTDAAAGLKLAHHAPGPPADPDTVSREPQPGDDDDVRSFIRTHLPDADGETLATRICLYTNSPDGHFILDRHPHHDRVTIACGFSGHGFKFASVIGEIMADLATAGRTALPAGFLSSARFAASS